MFVVFVAVFW